MTTLINNLTLEEKKLTSEVASVLRSYVYVYIDPRNGEIFYIGKGKGDRLFAHLGDTSETDKTSKISDIRKSGKEPQIDLLRYGLSDSEAELVEASAIDLIGKYQLTNKMSGYHKESCPRISSKELIIMLNAKRTEVKHKAILITINRLYRSDMTDRELYEVTRGTWRIGQRRNQADVVMSVYQGIVREVYKIEKWHPAGTLEYQTRNSLELQTDKRWEFEGEKSGEDIRSQYVGFNVGKSGQNPIRYINC
jgi:uncharacterized protein